MDKDLLTIIKVMGGAIVGFAVLWFVFYGLIYAANHLPK